MPITKVKPIYTRLDRAVNYAINPKKTCVDRDGRLGAAPEQVLENGGRWFATTLNCGGPQTAYAEIEEVKARHQKTDKVLGFRYIQSFQTGEATPEQAHAAGVEFARRCFGERFQVVVGTHLDTDTIHNHIVVNSVSFADGGKYRSTPKDYFFNIRATSDAVARDMGLSVIEKPGGKGKHYAEWMAEREGKHTKRGLLKTDIDAAIRASYTFGDFVEQMRRRGHTVNTDPNRKYITIKPKGALPTDRAFRLTERSMGAGYSEQDIKDRLARQRDGQPEAPRDSPRPAARPRRRLSDAAAFKPRQHRKMKGFIALYWHYCYFLKVVRHGGKTDKLPVAIRQEVTKLENYSRRFVYLYRHEITTADELRAHRQELARQIADLTGQRRPLYTERRDAASESQMAALSEAIDQKTAALRQLRKAKRLCDAIEEQAPAVAEKIRQAEAMMQDKTKEREERPKEKFRLL